VTIIRNETVTSGSVDVEELIELVEMLMADLPLPSSSPSD
jgi:hypothetical protein